MRRTDAEEQGRTRNPQTKQPKKPKITTDARPIASKIDAAMKKTK
jgi:hypothetical protein